MRYPPEKVAKSLAAIRTGRAGYSDAFPGAQGLLDLTDKNYNEIQWLVGLYKALDARLKRLEPAEALVKAKAK